MTVQQHSTALAALLRRRSVSPKRLGAPGPSDAELQDIVRAGLRAPDHGGLVPWRVIHIPQPQQAALAELFAQEKLRRDPLASADDLARVREHATRAPTLLAFVVRLRHQVTVPVAEQWLAAGAALGNLLNAADALGYGAIMLSGERCADATLCQQLGLSERERLMGFISLGSVLQAPKPAADKPLGNALSEWTGPVMKAPAGQ